MKARCGTTRTEIVRVGCVLWSKDLCEPRQSDTSDGENICCPKGCSFKGAVPSAADPRINKGTGYSQQ